jgi:hypothetical protein
MSLIASPRTLKFSAEPSRICCSAECLNLALFDTRRDAAICPKLGQQRKWLLTLETTSLTLSDMGRTAGRRWQANICRGGRTPLIAAGDHESAINMAHLFVFYPNERGREEVAISDVPATPTTAIAWPLNLIVETSCSARGSNARSGG